MDAIKNYLETMFLNLPNTPEVQKAKYELGQMMEDKYRELIADGKTENEAIGTVIAEFGNLDELAEDLGIDSVLHHSQTFEAGRMVPLTEVKEYLKASSRQPFCCTWRTLVHPKPGLYDRYEQHRRTHRKRNVHGGSWCDRHVSFHSHCSSTFCYFRHYHEPLGIYEPSALFFRFCYHGICA